MRKLILIISILSVFLATPAKAKLYDYYLERGLGFPSIEERVEVAQNCGISNYTGTFRQNIEFEKCLKENKVLGNILPTDNYDSFLSSPLSSAGTTIFVNAIPSGVTESIYTLYATDGTTPREKVKCTGTASSPYRLTGCVRGLSFSPVAGIIDETAGTGLTHSKNTRIAITDNINFTGKALNILGGNQETGGNVFKIGDNTTTTNKQIISANGDDLPYLQYNETTGKWQFSDNGVDTYNMVDGGSGLTASSTKAIGITDSKIYVNASSTTGMSFDANGALYQMTSSTGGISSDSNGIYTSLDLLSDAGIATSTPTANNIVMASSTARIEDGWLGLTTAGDMLYSDGNSLQRVGIGASSTILSNNGSAPVWSDLLTKYSTASATNLLSSNSEVSQAYGGSYTLKKTIVVFYPGTYRITFDIKTTGGSYFGKIYKNGSAYGTERTGVQTTYQTFSEDLYFQPGDRIQLYIYEGTVGNTTYARNFTINGTLTTYATNGLEI